MAYVLEKRRGPYALVGGKRVVLFSSNDYMGLSAHPDVLKAATEAAHRYGVGTGGAPGTTGTNEIHRKLAGEIATFKRREKAVIFASGYQANLSLHQALGGNDVVFYLDRLHHPSAVDGARLAKASEFIRFDHDNLEELEAALRTHSRKINIVCLPSVFTVNGDIAPLDRLVELKRKLGFILVLDEAHATGCIGQTGRGLEEHFNLEGAADFIMGTFSKALGSQGGFIAFRSGSEFLLKKGLRSFEYSTSLSAILASAALRSVELLQDDQTILSSLRRAKQLIIGECRQNDIGIIAKESMIMLIPCNNARNLQKMLLDDGYLAIPVKTHIGDDLTECLRVTPMAPHSDDDIRGFVRSLKMHLPSV